MSQRQIIGIEVWTGDQTGEHRSGDGLLPQRTHPTVYYARKVEGIVEMGSDGYPGGTYWIRYENGETHVFMENSVRRVIYQKETT